MSKKDKSAENRKSINKGRIAFGVTFLALTTIFGVHNLFGLAVILAASIGVKKFVTTMSEGLDLTTHNRQDAVKPEEVRKPDPEDIPLSGDAEADAVITKGQEMLKQIREANDAIPDVALTNQMDELERLCTQIFHTISEKPKKAPQIRKFMNYYLPTTLKMLSSYRTMQQRGVSATDMVEARTTLIRGMGMVLTACQKQLDTLYKDDMMDVSTDIDVLEQMLKRDGFADGGLGSVQAAPAPQARTAAAAQMGADVMPTLDPNIPGARKSNAAPEMDFKSFFQQEQR